MKDTTWVRQAFPSTSKGNTPKGHLELKVKKKTQQFQEMKEKRKCSENPEEKTSDQPGPSFKFFEPRVMSTPKGRQETSCTSAQSEWKGPLSEFVNSYLQRKMKEFKEEAMKEIRSWRATENKKRSPEPSETVQKRRKWDTEREEEENDEIDLVNSTDEESDGITEENKNVERTEENWDEEYETKEERQVKKTGLKVTEDQEPVVEEEQGNTVEDKRTTEVTGDEEGSTLEHRGHQLTEQLEKERDTVEEESPTAVTEAGEEQVMIAETPGEKQDTETASVRVLLQDNGTSDHELAHLAQSTEARERSAAFRLSPLRARISTLTVVEVFKVPEKDPKCDDKASFRVLEEPDGTLSLSHNSSVDNEWPTTCAVDAHETTLEEELGSVNRRDIVDICREGEPLSPMVLANLSSTKRFLSNRNHFVQGKSY